MAQTDLSVSALRARMILRGVTMGELASAAGVWPAELSQLLRGGTPMGPVRRARLEAAIRQLGLDQPVSEADAASKGPVFHTEAVG